MAFQSLVLKSALLLGLVMTGVVERSASADARSGSSPVSAPASVNILIASEDGYRRHTIYFGHDSVVLTQEAQLTLMEIADEISGSDDPAVSLTASFSDEILAAERLEIVAEGLEDAGFSMARVFQTAQIDILLAREL